MGMAARPTVHRLLLTVAVALLIIAGQAAVATASGGAHAKPEKPMRCDSGHQCLRQPIDSGLLATQHKLMALKAWLVTRRGIDQSGLSSPRTTSIRAR